MNRRRLLGLLGLGAAGAAAADPADERPRTGLAAHMARAFEMKRRAVSSGDQAYGAVVVMDGRLIGEAPSRVVLKNDPNAHAEREALKDAMARVGATNIAGAWLVSSSRPCSLCERAARAAGIAKMIHGESLTDAGAPRG